MAKQNETQFNQKNQKSNVDKEQWQGKNMNGVPSSGESGDTTEIDSQNDLDLNSDVSSNRQTKRTTDR